MQIKYIFSEADTVRKNIVINLLQGKKTPKHNVWIKKSTEYQNSKTNTVNAHIAT